MVLGRCSFSFQNICISIYSSHQGFCWWWKKSMLYITHKVSQLVLHVSWLSLPRILIFLANTKFKSTSFEPQARTNIYVDYRRKFHPRPFFIIFYSNIFRGCRCASNFKFHIIQFFKKRYFCHWGLECCLSNRSFCSIQRCSILN